MCPEVSDMGDPIEAVEQFEWVAGIHPADRLKGADYDIRVRHVAEVDHEIHTLENLGFEPVMYRAGHSGRLIISVKQR